MSSHKEKQRVIASIENASILRKFTILFLLMSVIPVVLLIYLYNQVKAYGHIGLTIDSLGVTLIFVVLGSLVGYFAMRAVVLKVINLSKANTRALATVSDSKKIDELSHEDNEVAVLARTFSEITKRLEDNVKNLELAKKTLHFVLAKVGEGISSMQNIDTFLELILETVTTALNGKVSVILLVDEEKELAWIKTVYGIQYDSLEVKKMLIEPGTTISSVIKSRKPLIVPSFLTDFGQDRKTTSLFEPPMICAPLIVHDRVKGIMTVSGHKIGKNFDEDEMNILFNLASQTAVAIENAGLNEDIEKTYFETISALALAVDAKDTYSRGHLDRVANYCVKIAKKLGLDNEDVKILREAARLHDVGKIGVPDEILKKAAALTLEEKDVMDKHPEIGESIIKPIRSLRHLCDIVRHHHEKLDGSGYPDGLHSNQISPLVRITTVADIYDALTTDRPYRPRFSQERAFHELRSMKNQLDQDIVEVFIEALEEENS